MYIIIHNNKDFDNRLEIVLHQNKEYIFLSPRDDDHADLIVDAIQRGVYDQPIIYDWRE